MAMADGSVRFLKDSTNPGTICRWCDFRRSCPAGAQVAPKDPWEAVDHLTR